MGPSRPARGGVGHTGNRLVAAVAEGLALPGEHLLVGEEDGLWDVPSPGGGQICAASSRCPDSEGANEDSALVVCPDAERLVLAVADGLGGLPAGGSASALALCALRDALRVRLAEGAELREAILSGFDRANRAVLQRMNGGATTLAVVGIERGRMRSYHVGDSGVLVFGGRGRVRMQTISHSPVGYAVEAGVLDEQEAMSHEDRHLVSNVVGDRGMHVGMSYPIRLKPLDTVLLASDGLFDNAYVEEVVQHLRKGPLDKAASKLIATCRERMQRPEAGVPSKPDDLTLLAYRPGIRRRGS